MSEPLVIVGCGGHGREVLGIVRAINEAHGDAWQVLGFVDDGPTRVNLRRVERLGVPYLGPTPTLLERDAAYVIGVGAPKVRRMLAEQIDGYGLRAAQLIHPHATVGTDVTLGDGVVVFAGARVTTNVTLGRHVHLNQNATVGHDCDLADYVSVNPLAAVSGECRLETAALIGTTAAVLQGLRIGAEAVVGAGACVVHDVLPGAVVKGVPAR
jgi:sugar O-acyltransferase (sialic acid O-acetyltransferase NeuD family)